jgi:hypothetical protein
MSEGMKGLVGQRPDKKFDFMGTRISIKKLSVAEVLEIQEQAKSAGEDENANFQLMQTVIKMSAEGAEDLTDEDFNGFPIDDLSKLSQEIMKFSGVVDKEKVGKGS